MVSHNQVFSGNFYSIKTINLDEESSDALIINDNIEVILVEYDILDGKSKPI